MTGYTVWNNPALTLGVSVWPDPPRAGTPWSGPRTSGWWHRGSLSLPSGTASSSGWRPWRGWLAVTAINQPISTALLEKSSHFLCWKHVNPIYCIHCEVKNADLDSLITLHHDWLDRCKPTGWCFSTSLSTNVDHCFWLMPTCFHHSTKSLVCEYSVFLSCHRHNLL